MRSTVETVADEPMEFTPAVFSPQDGVLFSAYGVPFGYCAFALSFEAACERLGATTQEPKQVLLAYQLNHHAIARAIKKKDLPRDGRRVVLEAMDFV